MDGISGIGLPGDGKLGADMDKDLAEIVMKPIIVNISASSPFNEYSGLISFKMDWFDLLAVQGTLKCLQHHNSKASVL